MIFIGILLLLCIIIFILGFTPLAKTPGDRRLAFGGAFLSLILVSLIPIGSYFDVTNTAKERDWLVLELEVSDEISIDLISDCRDFNKKLNNKKQVALNPIVGLGFFGIDYDDIDEIDIESYVKIIKKDKAEWALFF